MKRWLCNTVHEHRDRQECRWLNTSTSARHTALDRRPTHWVLHSIPDAENSKASGEETGSAAHEPTVRNPEGGAGVEFDKQLKQFKPLEIPLCVAAGAFFPSNFVLNH